MRRVASEEQPSKMWIPTLASGEVSSGDCWRCTSPSCTVLGEQVAERSSSFGASLSVKQVCPTGAIELLPNGEPQVNEDRCIRCGLCQVNCAVGAIAFDRTQKAMVVSRSNSGLSSEPIKIQTLFAKKSQARDQSPNPDPNAVRSQIDGMMDKITKGDASGLLGISDYLPRLIHNDLRALGLAPALRVKGANSMLSELVFEESGFTVLGEIEGSGDTLDSFRRLLSAASVTISRDKVKKEKVVLVLFLASLPNRRVDLFRLCGEVKRHLGVEIIIVPVAALQAAVLTFRSGFLAHFSGFQISDSKHSLDGVFRSTFGIEPGSLWGLTPEK